MPGLGRDVPAYRDDAEVRAQQEDHLGGGDAATLPQEAQGPRTEPIKQQLRLEIGEAL